jgi:hypothetical protein
MLVTQMRDIGNDSGVLTLLVAEHVVLNGRSFLPQPRLYIQSHYTNHFYGNYHRAETQRRGGIRMLKSMEFNGMTRTARILKNLNVPPLRLRAMKIS